VVGKCLEVPSSRKSLKRASGEIAGKAEPIRVAKRCVLTSMPEHCLIEHCLAMYGCLRVQRGVNGCEILRKGSWMRNPRPVVNPSLRAQGQRSCG